MNRREVNQKRSDFRSYASCPVWYRQIDHSSPTPEWTRTVTRDLSGGGMSIAMGRTDASAQLVKCMYEVQLVIPPSPIFVIAETVRVFSDDTGRLCVAMAFASVTPSDQDRIVRFVLNEGLGKM